MKKNIKLICLTFLLLASMFGHGLVFAKQNALDSKKWSIVVSSCDKYSQLWGTFFKALAKNWPELDSINHDLKIYLIANSKKYPDTRVETINIPNEISWSDNMLSALEKIDSKYILLFLDDYWVNTAVNQDRLIELIHRFEQEDAAYMRLDGGPQKFNPTNKLKNMESIIYENKFQNSRISLQVTLWEKKALQQLLRSGESAWEFEKSGSIRSSGYPKPFLSLISDPPIKFLNASHLGHITPDALKFAPQHDANFVNKMPVLQKYNWNLILKSIKHRIHNVIALFKRNIFNTEADSHRYIFENAG